MYEVISHCAVVFSFIFVVRHFILSTHPLIARNQHAKLDTLLFTAVSIPFAAYYNLQYDFTLDSNIKVLLGMALFGFLTGFILQLQSKLSQFDSLGKQQRFDFELSGQRQSMVKQMISMMIALLITLTTILTMVAVKDIYWLEQNPEQISNGLGKISFIKELVYIALVIGGYVVAIMVLWTRLMQKILFSQEHALLEVTQGKITHRLPVFQHDELGSMACLTNQMLDSLQVSQDEIKTTRDVAIVSLSALAESRDNETGAHIMRTQEYVKVLAEYLSQLDQHRLLLTPNYIELLYKSAPLHDVGKVGVPDSVLLKPGKLTDEEFEIMKGHAEIGAQALSIAEKQLGSSSFLRVAKEIALTHHEKWDGSGYPNQLSGEDIPLSGRLMALADVYDALISKRVYKPAFSHDKAKSIILEGNGKHFDPQVVDAFLAVEAQFQRIAHQYQDAQNIAA
ncbi:HD domain-containing phosphohydrolase [Vibrio hyugaensis]|uniref:HD domain-containing phosphohydrolase n=1 Tax=Vibrio hyugaensis TaxID=1534743 RepID=UPI0009E49092|nr:HD domain-containing phosphohydrolase [Vibrio hyugaensis]